LCLVRMIPFGEAWAEASTTLAFTDAIKQKLWMPGKRMPDDLVEMVQEKLVTVSPSFAQRTRSIVRRDDAAASSTVAELQKQSSAKEKAAAEAEEAKAAAAAEAELSELSSASEPPDEPADVFISFRFAEAEAEARALKSALEHAGVSVFLSGVSLGDDHAISQALASCRLAVIMASRTYGTATNSLFDTGRERNFILGQRKPLCLVRMIPFGEAWAEASTTLAFPDSIKQKLWMPGERMPDDLVEMVQEKLRRAQGDLAGGTLSYISPVSLVDL